MRAAASVGTAVLALVLCACGGGDSGDRAPAGAPAASASAAATPTAVGTAEPAPPAPPATTSGSLTAGDVPPAAALGPGWAPYEDPGGVEEGFQGNGSWLRERQPEELLDGLTPIGCASEPPELPVPSEALEGTYVGADGSRGVSIVLGYDDEARAASFMAAQGAIVRGCGEPAGGVRADDPLTLVIEPVSVGAERIVDVRREGGVGASPLTWTEVLLRSGSRVGLLSVGVESGGAAPDAAVLEQALRSALARG
jgi:hypothetical protein